MIYYMRIVHVNKGKGEMINLILMCTQNYILISGTCKKTAISIQKYKRLFAQRWSTENEWLQLFDSSISFKSI